MPPSTATSNVDAQSGLENLEAEEAWTGKPYSALRERNVPTADYSLVVPSALHIVELKEGRRGVVGCFDGTRPFALQTGPEPHKEFKYPSFEVISRVRGYLKDRSSNYVYEKPRNRLVPNEVTLADQLETQHKIQTPFPPETSDIQTQMAPSPPMHGKKTLEKTISPFEGGRSGKWDYRQNMDNEGSIDSISDRGASVYSVSDTNYVGIPTRLEDINIVQIESTKLIIHSQQMLEVIQGVVTYYPQQALTGTSIVFPEPFCALLHHYGQLEKLVSKQYRKSAYHFRSC